MDLPVFYSLSFLSFTRPHRIACSSDRAINRRRQHLHLVAPVVLLGDLLLLLGGEVILNVEQGADLLGILALQHRSDAGAGEVEEVLDVEEVGGHDDVNEGLVLLLVVILDKVGEQEGLVPCGDDVVDAGLEGLLDGLGAVVVVVLNVLENIAEGAAGDVGDGDNRLAVGLVLEEVLDEAGHASGLAGDEELDGLGVVVGLKDNILGPVDALEGLDLGGHSYTFFYYFSFLFFWVFLLLIGVDVASC